MRDKFTMVFAVACALSLTVSSRAQETKPTQSHSWTNVFAGKTVRFIRIEYRGNDWDDGMDARASADMNLLAKLRELGKGVSVATNSESIAIRDLRRYPKNEQPPFVFMTGSESIAVTVRDTKTFRNYLLGGGMLFADCGSPEWHKSFMGFIRRVLHGKSPMVIADDDPIFEEPYQFPNGAPPMWHHGGKQALGIKHEGRWIVFYHPGDINDAWTTGNSWLNRAQAENAFRLGINIVHYAWKHQAEKPKTANQSIDSDKK